MDKNQISFKQYRAIDLTILGAVLLLTQTLITQATNRIFADQLYVVSPVAVMVALTMMRWGPWAAIHAVLGGAVLCAASGGGPQHYLIYCAGNLLSMVALVFFRHPGKERVRTSAFLSACFAFAVQALMMLGRGAMALLLGYGMTAAIGFIASDSLSFLFTLLIVWIVRRIDGLFEDQKKYLLRIQSETKV